jgi:signal peptidase II
MTVTDEPLSPASAPAAGAPPDAPGASGGLKTRRTWLFYVTATCVLVLDQLVKWLVVRDVPYGASTQVLGNLLSFSHRHNTGAAFGLLPSAALGLAAVAAVVIVVLVMFGRRVATQSGALLLGISLQLGGAAGNFIDRIRLGYVVDFIDVHFWPVFNVADIGITCGAVIVVAAILFDPRLRDVGRS